MSNLTLGLSAADVVDARESRKPAARPHFSLTAFFERLSDAMYAADRRRAESDVARFVRENGGVLTDDLERQMSRRYGRIVGQ